MNQIQTEQQLACIRRIDREFDVSSGSLCSDETVPISLLRAATKMIVYVYPDNGHRAAAVALLLEVAAHLNLAEAANV